MRTADLVDQARRTNLEEGYPGGILACDGSQLAQSAGGAWVSTWGAQGGQAWTKYVDGGMGNATTAETFAFVQSLPLAYERAVEKNRPVALVTDSMGLVEAAVRSIDSLRRHLMKAATARPHLVSGNHVEHALAVWDEGVVSVYHVKAHTSWSADAYDPGALNHQADQLAKKLCHRAMVDYYRNRDLMRAKMV